MEEAPTIQMDSFPPDDQETRTGEAKTPVTIPVEDLVPQQGWSVPSPPPPYPTPPPPPPSAPQAGSPPQGRAGATVMMRPSAPPSLLAWLAVVEGPGMPRSQVFALQRETLVGRTAGQIVLSGDSHVSAQHAKIRLETSAGEEGDEGKEKKQVFVLYDLASTNGTFVGSRDEYRDNQVYRKELQDGDFILFGETTLVFKEV